MMSLYSYFVTLFVGSLMLMSFTDAFTVTTVKVVPTTTSTSSSTALSMGLFDAFLPKKEEKGKREPLKTDASVFAGRGKKVTIREDEDNAMWVDEPKAKVDPKKKGK